MDGWPFTNYQVRQIKKYLIIFIITVISIFLIGNIITLLLKEKIIVKKESYSLKDGFPIFTSSKEYINLVKSYPYDFGTKIKIYKIKGGESYWNIASVNHISIDTLIGANPFLTSLSAQRGIEIVIPEDDGILMPFDDIFDISRMMKLLNYIEEVKGDYHHSIFELFALDDIRFAFFCKLKPLYVNPNLQRLYSIRKIFKPPVKGHFSSLYGNRFDPFSQGIAFHNGIDIRAKIGTPFYPTREGMVSYTGWAKGYGLTIIVQHLDGYVTLYGHCKTVNTKKGDMVGKDDVIGYVGSTGRSTGSHLHFTIRRHGKIINPLFFIW